MGKGVVAWNCKGHDNVTNGVHIMAMIGLNKISQRGGSGLDDK